MISESSIISITNEQLSSDLGEEAVILHLESGIYYGLNQVAASIWNLIQTPKSVREIRDALLLEYDVELEACVQDLLNILENMRSEGLIEVKNEPNN